MIASGKDTQPKILEKKYALKLVDTEYIGVNFLMKNADGDCRRTTGQVTCSCCPY